MTAFKWSQTAGDNDDADSSINWQEGQAPRTVNNSARAMMAAVAKWRDDISGNLVTGGTSTAYTLTTNQVFTSLIDGIMVRARMSATSGSSPTLNVDSLGAKAIVTDVSATAVQSGLLLTGQVYSFVYDSTADGWLVGDKFELGVTTLANGGTGSSLSDPNADRILFWDDSAGVVTWLTVSTGLAISTTSIALSHLGLESLTDPGADRIFFWDDGAGSSAFLTVGDGLEISGTTLQGDIATTTEMEAASSTTTIVTPGRQHRHPGHIKAWGAVNQTGTQAIITDYGISSITDAGTGVTRFTFDTAFTSTSAYACVGTCGRDNDNVGDAIVATYSAATHSTTQYSISCVTASASSFDSPELSGSFCGDH